MKPNGSMPSRSLVVRQSIFSKPAAHCASIALWKPASLPGSA